MKSGHKILSMYIYDYMKIGITTQRLQCSSFLVMAYFLPMDSSIFPKKELLVILWVESLCRIHVLGAYVDRSSTGGPGLVNKAWSC